MEAESRLSTLRQWWRKPPQWARPIAFWLWNGRITRDVIDDQLSHIASGGFGGIIIHPFASKFRAGSSLGHSEPDFPTDDFFAIVRYAAEAAARLGLEVWLYDEGGWPSGWAAGLVVARRPDLKSRVIEVCQPDDSCPSRVLWSRDGEDVLVAAAPNADREADFVRAALAGSEVRLAQPHELPSAEALCFAERLAPDDYPDLLNPEATRIFIEIVYEGYRRHCGDLFGEAIRGIFTDEPYACGHGQPGFVGGRWLAWSPALAAEMDAAGLPWRRWLPMLFSAEALGFDPFERYGEEQVVQARAAYADAVARQFQRAYFEPLRQWCHHHGLIFTGHVAGEDNLPDHHRGRFFHFFRTAGALDAPGVDAIWRQIHPSARNFPFPAFAASALHMRPGGSAPPRDPARENIAISESFAVYGYAATLAELRWVADYQILRGINRIFAMAYNAHLDCGRCYGIVSHLGPGNPQWLAFPALANHIARLCAAVSASGHPCDIAVYYPIEAAWAFLDRPELQRAWQSLREICFALEACQLQFDFIDADALCAAEISSGALDTPGQSYSTIIVPDCLALPAPVMQRLADFNRSGGRVIFAGAVPSLCATPGGRWQFEEAARYLAERAFTLDARSEAAEWATGAGGLAQPSMGSVWDGMSTAMLGVRGQDIFAPAALKPDAVIIAPDEELLRMARLLAITVGRYQLEPVDDAPGLRIASRWLAGNCWLHLLFNESSSHLRARLAFVSDAPAAIELWDPDTGQAVALAKHTDPTEATQIEIDLPPGACKLIASMPPEAAEAQPEPESTALATLARPRSVRLVEQCYIENGALLRRPVNREVEMPQPLNLRRVPGLERFCGTIAYTYTFEFDSDRKALVEVELQELFYSAAVLINDHLLGYAIAPPFTVRGTVPLRRGENELVVLVATTLSAEILAPENLEKARAEGWAHPYLDICLDWHRETLSAGLTGPVRLWLVE